MRPTLKTGDKLFSRNTGNASKFRMSELTPVFVVKVGRRYFSTSAEPVSKWPRLTEYHIDTWREKSSGYAASTILYATEQEWIDEQETARIHSTLREFFSGYGQIRISLDALRQIEAIIEKEKQEKLNGN